MSIEIVGLLALVLGSSMTSGINLYLTVAGLGLAHQLGWIVLPGDLVVISHPAIIGLAALLYIVEFFADKIPYVDSAWDAAHTLIRPVGGTLLAYSAASEYAPVVQTGLALVGGAMSLDAHMVKAGTRVAINTSPEPVTNVVASAGEDAFVLGSLWLLIAHPWVMLALAVAFALFSIWLIPKLFRFFCRVFSFLFGRDRRGQANSSRRDF